MLWKTSRREYCAGDGGTSLIRVHQARHGALGATIIFSLIRARPGRRRVLVSNFSPVFKRLFEERNGTEVALKEANLAELLLFLVVVYSPQEVSGKSRAVKVFCCHCPPTLANSEFTWDTQSRLPNGQILRRRLPS